MTIKAQLDQLRETSFGCVLTAFGDLSSGLILRSSSETPVPREVLDALCDDATRSLAVASRHTRPDATAASVYGTSVVSFTAQRSHVFVRHDPEAGDLICAVIEKAQAIAPVLQSARETAARIAEAGS
ncbi:MAG: hypothetical protein GW798_02520 [Roseovarius sp.]|nr:hypothetical protein [Roseovarius sp.]